MPRLSIIVPVYKVEPYIHKCVDSILNQSFTDFELILVDDGSPDNCGKICDEYAQQDERVRVIHKKNGGVSEARNLGIGEANGEIIGFVDSDDFIEPNMYQDMMKLLEKEQLDIVCTDVYIVHGERKRFNPRYDKNIIFENGSALKENLNGNLDNAVWNKIYKKEVISDERFPLKRRYEDVATVYKWIANAKKVGYISKPHYYYRKTKDSFIGTSANSKDRYEHFIGYRERLEYAVSHNLDCVNDCERIAIEAGLGALTAFYATNEKNNSLIYSEVSEFILNINSKNNCSKMRLKNKLLYWSHLNCKLLHKIYAKFSFYWKRYFR